MLLAQFSETDCRYTFVLVAAQIQIETGWLATAALQSCVGLTLDSCKYQPAYHQPNSTVCKPYANFILTLTNKVPL
jgi:hypothetical protein